MPTEEDAPTEATQTSEPMPSATTESLASAAPSFDMLTDEPIVFGLPRPLSDDELVEYARELIQSCSAHELPKTDIELIQRLCNRFTNITHGDAERAIFLLIFKRKIRLSATNTDNGFLVYYYI